MKKTNLKTKTNFNEVLYILKYKRDEFVVNKKYKCGIVLTASEVKDINRKRISLQGSHINIDKNLCCYINNMYIKCTECAQRRLLLNRKEALNIFHSLKSAHVSIFSSVYKVNNLIKLELCIATRVKFKKLKKRTDLRFVDECKSNGVCIYDVD